MDFKYNGIKINYEKFGEGKPLLLLHGWMACIDAWAPVYRHFMKTRKVYVIDFPGQGGKSETLKEVWGVPEYSEMVRAFIKEMKIEKTDVIGHSFGGRVIIYLSSKYPELFEKIVLTDAAGIKPKMTIKKWFKIYTYKLGKTILKITTSKEKYNEKLEQYRKKHSSSDYASLNSPILQETFKKIINLDLTKKLKEIKSPTLLMWGENDKDTPLYMAKIMEKKIKDSGLVILKGAGHFSYLDAPGQYINIVQNFIGGN